MADVVFVRTKINNYLNAVGYISLLMLKKTFLTIALLSAGTAAVFANGLSLSNFDTSSVDTSANTMQFRFDVEQSNSWRVQILTMLFGFL